MWVEAGSVTRVTLLITRPFSNSVLFLLYQHSLALLSVPTAPRHQYEKQPEEFQTPTRALPCGFSASCVAAAASHITTLQQSEGSRARKRRLEQFL